MRKSKFTDTQIIDVVKRVESGFGVPEICLEMGISTATFYKLRAKYGGIHVSTQSRMKELEEKVGAELEDQTSQTIDSREA
jgi:putative transposase